jgi:hypothetical protein
MGKVDQSGCGENRAGGLGALAERRRASLALTHQNSCEFCVIKAGRDGLVRATSHDISRTVV